MKFRDQIKKVVIWFFYLNVAALCAVGMEYFLPDSPLRKLLGDINGYLFIAEIAALGTTFVALIVSAPFMFFIWLAQSMIGAGVKQGIERADRDRL